MQAPRPPEKSGIVCWAATRACNHNCKAYNTGDGTCAVLEWMDFTAIHLERISKRMPDGDLLMALINPGGGE